MKKNSKIFHFFFFFFFFFFFNFYNLLKILIIAWASFCNAEIVYLLRANMTLNFILEGKCNFRSMKER